MDIHRLTGWQTGLSIAIGCETAWVKAAENKRGPPYTRVTERELPQNIWYSARRRIDAGLVDGRGVVDQSMIVARVDKVRFALGLIGVGDELNKLQLI
jgi:hypothetical protein